MIYTGIMVLFYINVNIGLIMSNETKLEADISYSSSRIVKGQQANQGEFPYFISLLVDVVDAKGYSSKMCGGSLIRSNLVLTAKHCVSFPGERVRNIRAYPNYDNRYTGFNPQAKYYNYVKYVVHPGPGTEDLAIIYLNQSIPMTDGLGLIKLTNQSYPIGTICHFCGFGSNRYVTPQKKLMKIAAPIKHPQDCRYMTLGEKFKCFVVAQSGGKQSCVGDSGGPVVVKSSVSPSHDIQIGVISRGTGPGQSAAQCHATYELPINVFYYRDWILSHL